MPRCSWVNLKNKKEILYHDNEWGKPVYDDQKLFELLLLESFQAGLSWECILNKRENFRLAFDNFNVNKIANYNNEKIMMLLNNPMIIRNKLKIKAIIKNAQVFIDIQAKWGSFSNYIWHFNDEQIIYEPFTLKTTSALSDLISKDLYKMGMRFVGSTIIYSYLQAIGIINGHSEDCDFSQRHDII